MRAVAYGGFRQPPDVRELPDPKPTPGGAVLRVEATGLCRSDWHGWMGHDPDITAFPHVPGHELAGVVAAVGSEVAGFRPGDRVTAPFVCACGQCACCMAGDQQVCVRQTQPGFTHWGSYAEYVLIEHADLNLIRLPDELSQVAAATLSCRFSTAFRAVVTQGRVAAGQWVVVHGCGGVGLSAVMIAAACGARVVAVDLAPGALELAQQVGATECITVNTVDQTTGKGTEKAATEPDAVPGAASPASTRATEVAEQVRVVTGGGAHLSLDAVGSPAACAASIEGLRRRGRHVQVGLLPPQVSLPMARVTAHELEIIGTHGMPAHAYGPLIDLVRASRLQPELLVTRRIGLDQAPAALTALGDSAPHGITMITPHESTERVIPEQTIEPKIHDLGWS